MNIWDIIIIAAVIAAAAAAVRSIIKSKSGCRCEGCSCGCRECERVKKNEKNE